MEAMSVGQYLFQWEYGDSREHRSHVHWLLEYLTRELCRPKLTWAEGIRGLMGEKELMEEDWKDRDN